MGVEYRHYLMQVDCRFVAARAGDGSGWRPCRRHRARLDVNELLRTLTALLRTVLGERIELVIELSPNLGLVDVDPGPLEQVIVNLVVNAHDAMPKGGRLTVATSNVDVRAGSLPGSVKSGSYVVVTVTDTGSGMDSETMARSRALPADDGPLRVRIHG